MAKAPLPARATPRGAAMGRDQSRRGGRVVEGARLESVYTGNRIAGSNPAPSANLKSDLIQARPFP